MYFGTLPSRAASPQFGRIFPKRNQEPPPTAEELLADVKVRDLLTTTIGMAGNAWTFQGPSRMIQGKDLITDGRPYIQLPIMECRNSMATVEEQLRWLKNKIFTNDKDYQTACRMLEAFKDVGILATGTKFRKSGYVLTPLGREVLELLKIQQQEAPAMDLPSYFSNQKPPDWLGS